MLCNPRGLTLVELLIAIVVLTLVSICTLVYFQYGLGGIHEEGNRRAALELARGRMEQLYAANFTSVAPPSGASRWLTCSGNPCTWTLSSSATPESVEINGVTGRQMLTRAAWIDDPSAAGTDNLLLLSAKVWFRSGSVDDDAHRVELRSLRAP